MEYKPGMARLGVDAYFDEGQMFKYFKYGNKKYRQNDLQFETIPYRSSVWTIATFVDHAYYIHYVFGNKIAIYAINTLPVDHPLRLLLHPHLYRNIASTYESAKVLVGETNAIARCGPSSIKKKCFRNLEYFHGIYLHPLTNMFTTHFLITTNFRAKVLLIMTQS